MSIICSAWPKHTSVMVSTCDIHLHRWGGIHHVGTWTCNFFRSRTQIFVLLVNRGFQRSMGIFQRLLTNKAIENQTRRCNEIHRWQAKNCKRAKGTQANTKSKEYQSMVDQRPRGRRNFSFSAVLFHYTRTTKRNLERQKTAIPPPPSKRTVQPARKHNTWCARCAHGALSYGRCVSCLFS